MGISEVSPVGKRRKSPTRIPLDCEGIMDSKFKGPIILGNKDLKSPNFPFLSFVFIHTF
jgi:hypothetical protein